jgi:membrane-associated phospholipid phosphatase
VHKVANETVAKWGVHYLESPIYGTLGRLDPNLYAAFPSLHAAFPLLGAVYAWRRYRVVAGVLIAWSLAVWWAIVYLGEHYVVDALFALLYVAAATLAVELTARRLRPARPAS